MARTIWKPGTLLYPIPAVLVTCRDGEKDNIITVAWAGTLNTNPAMCYISIRPERYSYSIIKKTGEFVINLTTEKLAYATDWCGVRSGRDFDKFKEMHLTKEKAQFVNCPIIAQSPVALECKVVEVKEYGSHHMFIAEILAVDVEETYIDEYGAFDISQCHLMAYCNGGYYSLGKKIGKFGFSVQKKRRKIKKESKRIEKRKNWSKNRKGKDRKDIGF